MKIGIDARLLNESGVGRYTKNLILHLQNIDKENTYYIFLLPKDFDSLKLNKNFIKVKADFKWYGLEEQVKFPKLLNSFHLDLFHIPHFNVPIFYIGKKVVTIHDLIHQHFQMRRASTLNPLVFFIKQNAYKLVFGNAISTSQHVITVSNYVKSQLEEEWKLDSKKISVTYEGVEENIINLSKNISDTLIKKILNKFNIKPPFVFYLGNAHPHKNIEGLIKAFLLLRKDYQYLQLVLSGKNHYFWQKIKEKFYNPNIIYTGYLTDEEMVALYKSAKIYVVPSFEEGFGIPLLEAMACGVPVVSSNAASLPEIGDRACIYFDPVDIKDMSDKIKSVLNNQKLQKELIEKGDRHYKNFSWKKMAEQTLEIYKDAYK